MKKFAIYDMLNNLFFGFSVNEDDYQKALVLAKRGLSYWYQAGSKAKKIDPSDGFTEDDIDSFSSLGYSEPSELLLKKNYIEFQALDMNVESEEGLEICYF